MGKPMLDLIGEDTEVIDIRKVSTANIRKLPRFQQGLNIGYKGMCLFYSSELFKFSSLPLSSGIMFMAG